MNSNGEDIYSNGNNGFVAFTSVEMKSRGKYKSLGEDDTSNDSKASHQIPNLNEMADLDDLDFSEDDDFNHQKRGNSNSK